MKNYQAPEALVMSFASADILLVSGDTDIDMGELYGEDEESEE